MTHRPAALLIVALVTGLFLGSSASAKTGWKSAGELVTAVGPGDAFPLSDGRAVSVAIPDPSGQWPAATQFWEPKTKTWIASTSTPPLPNILQPVAIMLDDGRILLTGLCLGDCGDGSNTEIYDPATDKWMVPGQMKGGRYLHTMVKLQDGRVLILGGCTTIECWQGTTRVEVFDPKKNQFGRIAPMKKHRVCFTATLMADGRVLVAGGYNIDHVMADNETYDPASDAWTVNPPMKKPHVAHVAVLLNDGRVLEIGGDCKPALPCRAVDLFDPLTAMWTAAGPLRSPRDMLAAVRLQDGRILVAGGQTYFGTLWQYLETAEIYDPAQNKFLKAKSMAHQRAGFSMTTLPGGDVLAVGGDAWISEDKKNPGDAELYAP